MKMNFTARQMRVYDSVKETAEKKLSKFDKFFPETAEMDVTFSMPHGLENRGNHSFRGLCVPRRGGKRSICYLC